MPQKTTRETKSKVRPKQSRNEITQETSPPSQSTYIEAIGRRKTSIARVRIMPHAESPSFLVNGKPLEGYFQDPELQKVARESLEKLSLPNPMGVAVRVTGGGIHAQAQAIRHGLARALVQFDQKFRSPLKALGYLTRDPRMRERKKFGLKRARRARQWRKR